jgi:hypothetical protein
MKVAMAGNFHFPQAYMHIVSDMCKYGKPKEANTEVGEKNHKVFAKCIG